MTAPPRPRVPLMDTLYYVLHDYRVCKATGSRWTAEYRRRALEIIAEIKGEHNAI